LPEFVAANNEIEPDIENTCQARLNEINNNEETSYLFDDVYGNDEGRTILERLANMEKKIESLEQGNKSLRQKSESYEAELGILRLRTGDGRLTETTVEMRYRYLYNFGIKILGKSLNTTMIRRGNKATHEGNIELDVVVFQEQNPPDEVLMLFKELYGLEYSEARWLTGQCIP
jgi:hypothetical protein